MDLAFVGWMEDYCYWLLANGMATVVVAVKMYLNSVADYYYWLAFVDGQKMMVFDSILEVGSHYSSVLVHGMHFQRIAVLAY